MEQNQSIMANKLNETKNQGKRPDRNAEATSRNERNSDHAMESGGLEKQREKSAAEKISRRGYYSRNGYGSYRGL